MQDSKFLHFLKHFPPWVVLTALFILLVVFYYWTGDQSYKEWAGLVLAGLFTALGIRFGSSQPNPTQENKVTDGGSLNVFNPPVDPPKTEDAALSKPLDEITSDDADEMFNKEEAN